MHITVAQAEMMPDFVDQHMRDEVIERFAGFAPFVEDRAAIEMDRRGHVTRLRGLTNRPPGIKARQVERIVDAQSAQDPVLGKILDDQQYPGKVRGKSLGQAIDRRTRQPFDVGKGWGQLTCDAHPCDIAANGGRAK